jgi:hypothetical protein
MGRQEHNKKRSINGGFKGVICSGSCAQSRKFPTGQSWEKEVLRWLVLELQSSVQASVLDRLGDVGGLDFFAAGEIGDRAADFEDPAVGAGA